MNKLTQLMVGALALSVTSSLSAIGDSQASGQKPAFQGFHIGGNIGYGVGTGHFKTNTKINPGGIWRRPQRPN